MNQRPLFAFFAGCWLGEAILHIHWMVILITLFLLCGFLVVFKERGSKKGVFLLLIGMLVGEVFMSMYTYRISKEESLYEGKKETSIVGRVTWKGNTKNGFYLLLENNYDVTKDRYIEGDIIIYFNKERDISMGHRILINGQLETFERPTNLGEFPLDTYYKAKNINFRMFVDDFEVVESKQSLYLQTLNRWKEYFYNQNQKNYKGKALQIIEAMTLGDKTDLEFETRDMFQQGGLLHVLAISGLHISMIGASIYKRIRQIGIGFWPSFIVCTGILLAYCQMTGNSISALRATIMLCIYMFGQCFGKSYDLLTSLAASSIILLLTCPIRAIDTSFVYSVWAVIIIGMIQSIQKKNPKGLKEKIKYNLCFSLLLQVAMLPISIYYQYEFYLSAVIMNFLLLPIISICFSMAIISLVLPIPILVSICQFLFQNIIYIIEFVTRWDGWRVVTGHIPFVYVIIMYVMLLYLWKGSRKRISAIAFLILLMIPCFVPRNRLAFVNVGQGDGIVFTCGNCSVLIDGGSTSKKNIGRYVLLPYLKYSKVKKLDYAILTHTDEDHYSGMLELLELGYINHLILGDVKEDDTYDKLILVAKKNGTKVSFQGKGDVMKHSAFTMKCLHPLKGTTLEKNAASQVYQLNLWNTKFLLTGDVEKEGENELIKENLEEIDILKVAHHGSKYTTSKELLDKIHPKIGIISAGIDNRYGHPHEELIKRLRKYQVQILDTRKEGMIWVTKGKKGVEIHIKKG